MSNLVIVRHGQSAWNLENRFTGDVDVDLTPQGATEAKNAGTLLSDYQFDKAYTSVLKRAIRTLEIILKENNHPEVPIIYNAALNERRYGELQGLNKTETEQKFGHEQVLQWRRSYDVRPPGGESLEDTYNRVIPYYQSNIEPELKKGKSILVVAHGNSLRALVKFIENISVRNIVELNLATGVPKLYEFDREMKVIKNEYLKF